MNSSSNNNNRNGFFIRISDSPQENRSAEVLGFLNFVLEILAYPWLSKFRTLHFEGTPSITIYLTA